MNESAGWAEWMTVCRVIDPTSTAPSPEEQDCDGPLTVHIGLVKIKDDEVEKRPVRAVPGIPSPRPGG